MKQSFVDFVEKNVHGAWVVRGAIGIRQYYGYTKSEAVSKYRSECRETVFVERKAPVV